MKLITNFIHYQPFCGAIDTYALIDCYNKLEELDNLITELYPSGITEEELNVLLWLDSEWILNSLGIEVDND